MTKKRFFIAFIFTISLALLLAAAIAQSSPMVSTTNAATSVSVVNTDSNQIVAAGEPGFSAINAVPIIDSFSPIERTITIKAGVKQEFNVTASDVDGDALTIKWFLNGAEVETGNSYIFKAQTGGNFEVKVVVLDGKASVWRSWNVIGEEKEQPAVSRIVQARQKIQNALKAEIDAKPDKFIKIIIRVKDEKDLGRISGLVKAEGGKARGLYKVGKFLIARVPAGRILKIAEDSEIEGVWADTKVYAMLDASVAQIAAPNVWAEGFSGRNVKIAVLDTGIDSSHPMLQGKIVLQRNFSSSATAGDVEGHGTHVAGIAAGTTLNGGDYNGVAPDALLFNGKVLGDDGTGDFSWVIASINWAVDPDGNTTTDDGADVINMSLGAASQPYEPVELAIKDAVERGVTVVVSSGNCGSGCPSSKCSGFIGVTTPGTSPDALTVGAVDDSNNVACFSSGDDVSGVGIKPDVVAPGVDIVSSYPNNMYVYGSGTSMSAPHVAGAAALLLEANPELTPLQIKGLLELNAIDLGAAGKDTSYGSGMVYLADIVDPKIILSDSSISATMELGQVYRTTIKIYNYGADDLKIYSVNSAEGIETILEKQTIKAAESTDLNIQINSTAFGVGSFNESVELITNIGTKSITVSIQVDPTNNPVINSINIDETVFRGQVQDIVVDATDDVSVSSVTVQIISPNGTGVDLQLVLSGDGLWRYLQFQMPSEVDAVGRNTVIITATDNENNTTVYETYFDLVNFILNLPEEFVINTEAEISLTYKNTSTTLKQAETTFELFDKTGIKVAERTVSKDAYSGALTDLNWSWLPTEIGDYVLRTTFFEDSLQLEQRDLNITVLIPETIGSIDFVMNPTQVVKGDTVNYSLTAYNTGTTTVDAFVEINLTQNDNIYDVVVSETKTITAGTSESFNLSKQFLLPAGQYTAIAKLHYGNREKQSAIDFNSTTPANGSITQIYYTTPMYIDQNQLFGVEFINNGNVPLDVIIEGRVFKDSLLAGTVDFGAARVPALGNQLFEANYELKDLAGDFNLQVIALYEGNETDQNMGFYVTDNRVPEINEVAFSSTVQQNNPLVVSIKVKEHSDISSAIISVNGTTLNLQELWRIDNNVTLSATFSDTSQIQTYNFTISVCDEFSNCSTSNSYYFDVVSCTGQPILVVSEENYFVEQLQSAYCVSQWKRSESPAPELSYLQKFDAVVWGAGNDLANVDEDDAIVLIDFIKNGGRLLLEGSDIAFRHKDDNFMQEVAHAVQYEDVVLITMDANASVPPYSNLIIVSRKHPVVSGLSQFDVNINIGPYPDAVTPTNGGISLADWNAGNSAMVLFNDYYSTNARVLFLPFTFNALEQDVQNQLLSNAMDWLLAISTIDLSVDDITLPSYVIEGILAQIDIALTNDQSTELNIYVDGVLRQTLAVSGNNATTNLTFTPGEHSLEAFINPNYTISEKSYLNNSFTKTFRVATSGADLTVVNLAITPLNPKTNETVNLNALIENIGGTTADATVQFFIDGNLLDEKSISLNYGESSYVSADWDALQGIHTIRLVINPSGVDSNNLNNELNTTLYVCTEGKLLVVGDDDTESYTSDNPSSVQSIEQILQSQGYCVDVWKESEKGVPTIDYLNNFNIVIWSAGNYWNTVIDENDMALLNQYNGNILFEGADIAFDHNADSFMQSKLHSMFERDLLLDVNSIEIILGTHEILNGITSIDLNQELCPYPDSVLPTDGISIADWNNANSAIIIYESAESIVYFTFSIDAIVNETVREQLILNSIEWLSETRAPPAVTVTQPNGGETVSGIYPIQFSVSDPDNDSLSADLYYSAVEGAKENLIVNDLKVSPKEFDDSASGLIFGAHFNDTDVSTEGEYATVTDAATGYGFSKGRILGGLDLDGNQCIGWPNSGQSNLEMAQGSISFWTSRRGPDNTSTYETLLYANIAGWATDTIQLDKYYTQANNLRLQIQLDGDPNIECASSSAWDADDGKWHHIVLIWDVNKTGAYSCGIYVDKVMVASDTTTSLANKFNDGQPIVFGGHWNGIECFNEYNGIIDEVQIYNTVLSEADINKLYDQVAVAYANCPNFDGNTANEYTCTYNWGTSAVPDADYYIDAIISDGFDTAQDSSDFAFTVKHNTAPVIESYYPTSDPTINEGETQDFNITALDLDGDPLAYIWYLDGNIVSSTDSYTYTSDYESVGTYDVNVIVSDGEFDVQHSWLLTVLDADCHTGSNGDWSYCSDSCQCDVDEGDCDGDSQCKTGLICVNDVGPNYGWSSYVDVCQDPSICTDECVVGEKQCNGDYAQECGNYDEDYCYEWQDTYCEYGCLSGECSSTPIVKVRSDLLDGYINYRNGAYYARSSSYLRAGHYSYSGNYYWRRAVLEFYIGDIGKVDQATFFLDYRGKSVYNETCSFDLYSIETLGSSIDSYDWNSHVFEKVKDNWFNESISGDISVDVTNAWNNAINAGRDYLALRIAMDNEESYTSTTDRCMVYLYDTGAGGTDPYINYVASTGNSAPVIESYSPLENPTINEGEQQIFSITKYDPDNDPLTVKWYLDSNTVLADSDSYTYAADYESDGNYIVSVIVSDRDLNASQEWLLTVLDVPIACYIGGDCGIDGYIDGNFCVDNNVVRIYREYSCINPGTPGAECTYTDINITQETCTGMQICDLGQCVEIECFSDLDCDDSNSLTADICINPGTVNSSCEHTAIECTADIDCGIDSYINENFCIGNGIFRTYRSHTCLNPGLIDSQCIYNDENILQQECSIDQICELGVCYDVGCSTDVDCDDFNALTIDICMYPGTADSYCSHQAIACNSNTDCGIDGYIDGNFCLDGNVMQAYRTFTCFNPGTIEATCSHTDTPTLIEQCTYGCSAGVCITGEGFTWIVTGTGIETWTETVSDSIELTTDGTKEMVMQADAVVDYSVYLIFGIWYLLGSFDANKGDIIEIGYMFDGMYGYVRIRKNGEVIRQGRSWYVRGIRASYSADVERTAERTATDSGTATITAEEGTKDLGPFSAEPQPLEGGTITNVNYSVEDDNPNVETWLDLGHVYARIPQP